MRADSVNTTPLRGKSNPVLARRHLSMSHAFSMRALLPWFTHCQCCYATSMQPPLDSHFSQLVLANVTLVGWVPYGSDIKLSIRSGCAQSQ